MIRGVHTMLYSSHPEELRAFVRDKLGFKGTDVGEGWLLFDLPEADLGVHPADPDGHLAGRHDISFFTDDIETTVRQLRERGVTFVDAVHDVGYGRAIHFELPGAKTAQLYQPYYSK